MKYTTDQKKAYFQQLRARWMHAKKTANTDEIKAIIENHGWNISVLGYAVIDAQMKAQGLNGLPYLDAKTYRGWLENGFQVQKGQKSTLSGITWINVTKKNENDEDDSFLMPKEYKLFHRSQVQEV